MFHHEPQRPVIDSHTQALGLKELPSLKAWCGELDIVQECACSGVSDSVMPQPLYEHLNLAVRERRKVDRAYLCLTETLNVIVTDG